MIKDKAKNNPDGIEAKSIQVLQNSEEVVVVVEGHTDVQSTLTV